MSNSVLEPLLSSPELFEHFEALNRAIVIEQQRRRKFYEEITEDKKWEFINGEVIMHSPATNQHNRITGRLFTLLSVWVSQKQLGQVTFEKTLCQFPRNDYEPDIVFFGTTKASQLQPDTYFHPVPDLVVEVLSPSTEKIDRGVKFEDYQAHGVQEYWMVDPEAETIEQCLRQGGHFERRTISQGSIVSKAVAGFDIPVRAIFDDAANAAAVRQLLG